MKYTYKVYYSVYHNYEKKNTDIVVYRDDGTDKVCGKFYGVTHKFIHGCLTIYDKDGKELATYTNARK